jgi:hypothetical protein
MWDAWCGTLLQYFEDYHTKSRLWCGLKDMHFFESVKKLIKHTYNRKDLFCPFPQCLDDEIHGKQHTDH